MHDSALPRIEDRNMIDKELINLYKESWELIAQVDNSLPQSERDKLAKQHMIDNLFAATELGKRGYILSDENEWYHFSKEN